MSMSYDPVVQMYAITSTTLGTFARTLTAQVLGGGQNGDDDSPETETVDAVEVMQPLGLFARPLVTARTEGIGVEIGDEIVIFAMLDKSGTPFTGVNAVEPGETRVYGAKEPSVRLRFRADGSIDLETKIGQVMRITAGGSANIVLNGGTIPVAKEGSITSGHTHLPGAFVAGPYAVTGASASATDTIATGAGSQRVLVP